MKPSFKPHPAIGLLGAGAHARELASYCDSEIVFNVVDKAFADKALKHYSFEQIPAELLTVPVVTAVGAPAVKQRFVAEWEGTYGTVLAQSAIIGNDITIGEGSVLAPGVVATSGIVLGKHVLLNTAAVIAHDCKIGDFATVSPRVVLGGGCSIGAGVFIGIGATLRDGVCVGEGAVIGAGAVVLEDVAPGSVVVGVPARAIRLNQSWLASI